jgi:hypothetical protein
MIHQWEQSCKPEMAVEEETEEYGLKMAFTSSGSLEWEVSWTKRKQLALLIHDFGDQLGHNY